MIMHFEANANENTDILQEFVESRLLIGLLSNFTYTFIGVQAIHTNCFTFGQTIVSEKYHIKNS